VWPTNNRHGRSPHAIAITPVVFRGSTAKHIGVGKYSAAAGGMDRVGVPLNRRHLG
jgi:hypothetical protein